MWLLPRGMQLGSHPVGAAALPCERLRPWPQISSWTGLVTFLDWPVVGFTPQTSYSAFPPSAWENSQLSSLSPRDTSSSSKAGDTPNGKQNCSQGGGNRGGGGKDRWPPHPFPWSALEAGQEGGAGVELGSPHTPPHLQSRGTLNLCSSSSPDSAHRLLPGEVGVWEVPSPGLGEVPQLPDWDLSNSTSSEGLAPLALCLKCPICLGWA